MSWSVSIKGTKEEAAKQFALEMTANEDRYSGKEEGKDVALVKERGLALIEAQQVPDGMLVTISAYGSHSTSNDRITNAGFNLTLGCAEALKPQ